MCGGLDWPMIWVPALRYEEHWHNKLESLRVEYKDLLKQNPDARDKR
jgi:hypothetical protein